MNEKKKFRWGDVEPSCVCRMVLRNLWMIVAAILIAVLGFRTAVTWLWTPEYSSTVTYAVLSKSGSANSYGNYAAANEVAAKFSSMLESKLMQNVLCDAMGLSEVPGTISAQVVGETNMLQVTAVSHSPRLAFQMVRTVDTHYKDLGDHIDKNAILHVLVNPQAPSYPSNAIQMQKMSVVMGILGGGAMTAALVWFSISRDTVQNRSAARHKLESKILATLPREKKGKKGKNNRSPLITQSMVSFYFKESIYRLRTSVEQAMSEIPGGKVLLITSVTAGEGKSTVAANLALALAQKHKSVLLIDADLRNPTQTRVFEREPKIGLGTLLTKGPANAKEALLRDPHANLYMILQKDPIRPATELLSSQNMADLVAMFRDSMDYIIIDTPPVGMFTDGDLMADIADASALVIQQDTVPACDINDTADALDEGKAQYLGCILNRMHQTSLLQRTAAYGGGYGYGYGYGGYGYADKQKHH